MSDDLKQIQRHLTDSARDSVVCLSPVDNVKQGSRSKTLFICHIIFKLDFGGLENGLVNLINKLPFCEYRHVILSLQTPTDFQKRIRRKDVEIYDIGKREGKDIRAYRRVWRLLRDLRPDIVHTRNIPTVDMLVPAALAGVSRLVHSEHGLDVRELDGQHKKYNMLRRLSRLIVDQYVTVSFDLAKWLNQRVGIPDSKISLIYNGVDTETFCPGTNGATVLPAGFAPKDAVIIGTVGRLEPVKDQITLTLVFLHILELHPELRDSLRLVIVGDGSLRTEIERMLKLANARELAWLPGFCSDTAELYRAFSMFVLPSRREGISNTVLEAMASGLPVVATRVGGNPEIVDEGVTGQLVPADAPGAMAEAILKYIDAPEFAERHGCAGRARAVSSFSLEAMVNGYRRVYESL